MVAWYGEEVCLVELMRHHELEPAGLIKSTAHATDTICNAFLRNQSQQLEYNSYDG
jgi:hypothetical protein